MKFPYGIDIEVVKALADVYNFTIEYIEPPPGEFWGVLTENGTWNGMVGKISRNEADMGVANLFLTLHRLGAVDYSAPYDAEVSCFMARTDPPAPRWKSLSLPFQLPTWLAMLVGLLSIAAIAINRCVLITIPKWYPKIFTATNTAVTIACIWLLSVVLLLFPLLEAYGKFGYNDSTDECDFVDSTERGQTPRNVMMFAGYFFPCGVIIVSYALIFYKARMSSIKMKAFSQGNAQNTANKTAQRPAVGLRSRDIRIARTIAAIFVAFIICCTPVSVLHYLDKTVTSFICRVKGLCTNRRKETALVSNAYADYITPAAPALLAAVLPQHVHLRYHEQPVQGGLRALRRQVVARRQEYLRPPVPRAEQRQWAQPAGHDADQPHALFHPPRPRQAPHAHAAPAAPGYF
ncbi:melatonin receptor type 1A-like isoform X1 [Penaeus monodon]|uniref:melatonin receptor type 1A-like isoform X1 n=1 Tax=Penaeus monodon TaxID=6687 RepID=UPI0018A75076|nr:melatonin receptor type 1A-like isoform X1 [Penaeus monodon]